jgi:hypothetical protein
MAHNNTLFAQILSLIPRHEIQFLEGKHKCGRSSRLFGFKQQLAVMLFIQLAARNSLRDGLRCLTALGSRLYHWGLRSVARSTVAEANKERPVGFFQELFERLYRRCLSQAPKHKFRFKSKLFSIDSTTISLCLSVFPWASFKSRKAGVKMHTVLDHDGCIPAFVTISEAKAHDRLLCDVLHLPTGSIVVADRAYNDYQWFNSLSEAGVFFVTRQKSNAVYQTLKSQPTIAGTGVTSDQIIKVGTGKLGLKLRRVQYHDSKSNRNFAFLTNNFRLAAKTIADIYKERWKIELFFKEIKQNLHIKKFVGTSENAVWIQLYTALIAYLLLAYMKFLAGFGLSVQQLFQLAQLNLLGTASMQELLTQRRTFKNLFNDYPLLNSMPC